MRSDRPRLKQTLSLESGTVARAWTPAPALAHLRLRERSFAFCATSHQVVNSVARRFAVVQNEVHLGGNGHFNAAYARQFDRCVRAENAFGDHAVHGSDDVGKLASAPQFHSYAPVARQAAGAGKDKVADSGKSSHRFLTPPAGDDKARYLGQTAGDQGCDGVMPEPQAIANPGRDGNNVF